MLVVDTRWSGQTGIGRFASEVVDRINIPFARMEGSLPPTSPLDAVNPARLKLGRRDLVYSPGYNAGLSRSRQLITLHDLIHLQVPTGAGRAKRVYYERVVRPAIRRAGSVLTVSKTSREAIIEWLGRDASGIDVVEVGNGCSPAFIPEGPRSSLAEGALVYVGSLMRHKNFEVVARALRLRPEYRLVAVVRDSVGLVRLVDEYGIAGQVVSAPAQSDAALAALYRGANGVLLPSVVEGFGLPALEALSVGTPVAFYGGARSVREIVGSSGVAVDSAHDPEAWAAAMDALVAHGTVEPGRAWRERYDWHRVGRNVAAAIEVANG
ncbi:glycosyltransferase family 4 protein [Gryllotalpicola reticulitermitis]|uniref:Glycosyltransferase family 4 protein n=1 Tax=Gryllotalpicola reticulitermitis TaxID=1184153 RepID=A0ABV8Q852_9MICO